MVFQFISTQTIKLNLIVTFATNYILALLLKSNFQHLCISKLIARQIMLMLLWSNIFDCIVALYKRTEANSLYQSNLSSKTTF